MSPSQNMNNLIRRCNTLELGIWVASAGWALLWAIACLFLVSIRSSVCLCWRLCVNGRRISCLGRHRSPDPSLLPAAWSWCWSHFCTRMGRIVEQILWPETCPSWISYCFSLPSRISAVSHFEDSFRRMECLFLCTLWCRRRTRGGECRRCLGWCRSWG